MMASMSKRMMSCDEASFLISYKQENKLSYKQRMQLGFHIFSCHLCRKYDKQISQLNKLVERYRQRSEDPACMHHLCQEDHQRIEKALEESH